MNNKPIQPFWLKYFRHIKLFQYFTYFISILFFILSATCSQIECGAQLKITHQNSFQYLFLNLTDDVLTHNGVELLILLQTLFLIISFIIATFIGLKILPRPLSEKEKKEIICSPNNAFRNIFFSKILFCNVRPIDTTFFDMRNEKFNIVADLYLLHFKIIGKGSMLIFMFLILFIAPIFVPLDNKAHYFQLLLNFFKINMSLFLFLELIMFSYSKLLTKQMKNVA